MCSRIKYETGTGTYNCYPDLAFGGLDLKRGLNYLILVCYQIGFIN